MLTLGEEPCREIAVTWRTDDSVRRASAEFGIATPEPDLGALATTVAADTQALDLALSDWNHSSARERAGAIVRYHTARFEALQPRTTYAYRVGARRPNQWSEWHQFTTPPCPELLVGETTVQPDASAEVSEPLPDAQPSDAFRFLYFGDLQNGVLSHGARVVRTAYAEAPDAAFALYAGDLVNDGHWDFDWERWHRAGGWLHATLPVVPVVGNHEVRSLDRARRGPPQLSILWRAQFALPEESDLPSELAETVYRFDIGPARFFVLNTSFGQEEQAPWLIRQLEQAQRDGVRWQIVSFHFPTFSNAADRDNPELRAFVRPLFAQYGVDLVLQGHDHSYSRGHDAAVTSAEASVEPTTAGDASRPSGTIGSDGASDNDAAPGGTATGPIYVVSVAGAKQYRQAADLWSEYAEGSGGPQLDRSAANTQLFQVVEIAGDRLSYRAYTADGTLYDGFELLQTTAGAPKRLIDISDLPTTVRTFENTGPYRDQHWR